MPAERLSTPRVVLITRPLGAAADSLRAATEAAGYTVYHQPLLELQGITSLSAAQRDRLLELHRYQHIIFISANAVHFGMAWIEAFWPQLPVGLCWYAMGDATAARLQYFGVNALTPGQKMSTEGLLAHAALQNIQGQRVLIVKGEGGRDTLTQQLTLRGAVVEELACYRRSLPDLPPGELAQRLRRWAIEVILISSGEGLVNLQLLLRRAETSKLKHVGLVVPSQRVARLALDAGFDQVTTADNASDAAMLRALHGPSQGTGD